MSTMSAPSCSWREISVAVCTDGSTRLLVSGRRVDRGLFDRVVDDLLRAANASVLVKAVYDAGSMTTRDLADAEGIADTAASMRLKAAYSLGLLRREREGSRFRYYIARPLAGRQA